MIDVRLLGLFGHYIEVGFGLGFRTLGPRFLHFEPDSDLRTLTPHDYRFPSSSSYRVESVFLSIRAGDGKTRYDRESPNLLRVWVSLSSRRNESDN